MDKLDYFARDAYFLGLPLTVNSMRYIRVARVVPDQQGIMHISAPVKVPVANVIYLNYLSL